MNNEIIIKTNVLKYLNNNFYQKCDHDCMVEINGNLEVLFEIECKDDVYYGHLKRSVIALNHSRTLFLKLVIMETSDVE